MKAGFARVDITPRVGVQLSGYGPFINRVSEAIRDRLWARAMAVECRGTTIVIVSCDIIGLPLSITDNVRNRVNRAAGIAFDSVMVHCTHSHSGPGTGGYIGWGEPDPPYLEVLPGRIASACVEAVKNLRPCSFSHGTAPCEGIGYNRVYDEGHDKMQAVHDPGWRPEKPELTDTECHVFTAHDRRGRLLGFASCFGCHPVVGGAYSRYIHGDFTGIATNSIEREQPGAVGLFLQGALGDVNSCAVHLPDADAALTALDEIAGRYAAAVEHAMASASTLEVERVSSVLTEHRFRRVDWDQSTLQTMLAEEEAVLNAPGASDGDREVRMAAVNSIALKKLLRHMARGENMSPLTQLHGIAIGPAAFLATPLEVFQKIKNTVAAASTHPIPLVLSTTGDTQGYAVDDGDTPGHIYARDRVPFICGRLPFADIYNELCEKLLDTDHRLNNEQVMK